MFRKHLHLHIHHKHAAAAKIDDQSAERQAALTPDSIGDEIIKNANIHLTIAMLSQTIAKQVEFDSATTARAPDANKSIWDTIKDLTNNADIWRTSDSSILKITGLLPQTPPRAPIELVFTIDISKHQQSENMFSVEILNISRPDIEEYIPEFEASPLTLKTENGSLIPVTEYNEMRGTFLRDYQAQTCIKFAESLKEGWPRRFGNLGASSGKGSILATVLSWLQHTAGQHANFICILRDNELATQFKTNDVRNSDVKLFEALVLSSEISSMDEWNALCTSSGKLLVIERSDKDYNSKLMAAIATAAMVVVDEGHEIDEVEEWALIQKSNCLFAVSATPSQVMQDSFENKEPVVEFSTADAIKRKMVRGVVLKDLGNSVPNDRLFLDAYLNYVGMTSIDIENNTRLFALAQKSFVFCLDTPAEAQKILEQLNSFAIRDPQNNQAERTKLQLNLMSAKKTVDEKAHKIILASNSPQTARVKVEKWDEENPDRSLNIRDFAADIQYAQKGQLAATINAIAMQALFPAPNKGFDFYQEQIVSHKYKKTLATNDAELAIFRKWQLEKNAAKKATILKKNPCIQNLINAALNDRKSLSETISAMIVNSALPEEHKYTLQEACIKTAMKIVNTLAHDTESFGDALINGREIDLDIFGARYAELVLEDTSEEEAKEKLALLNYGFTMNLISQGLHADKLKFSTGTSIPSVLGVMVAGGSQSDVLSKPEIITQMLARGIRGPNGACFMAISTNTHGNRPLVELSDLTPMQSSVTSVLSDAYRRSDKLAQQKEAVLNTRNMFCNPNFRRTKSEGPEPEPAPDPTRFFVKQKTEEIVQRFRAATAPAAVMTPTPEIASETDDLRNSMNVTMRLEELTNSDRYAIDVDNSYSDSEDDESNRKSLKKSH